eukprot:1945579-Prymnesium_polylepis.1
MHACSRPSLLAALRLSRHAPPSHFFICRSFRIGPRSERSLPQLGHLRADDAPVVCPSSLGRLVLERQALQRPSLCPVVLKLPHAHLRAARLAACCAWAARMSGSLKTVSGHSAPLSS